MRDRTFLLETAEELTALELLRVARTKLRRRIAGIGASGGRYRWTPGAVIDALTGPELLLRNYLEERDLRQYLQVVQESRAIKKAADIGCGFGRLEMLLSEYAKEVVGFEREPALAETARLLLSSLQPSVRIITIEDLTELPASEGEFDFTMTFTVLMHLTETKARAVIEQMKRMTAPGGFVLLCEQTDSSDRFGDVRSERALLAQGRDIAVYEAWMQPMTLVKSSARVVEPTYWLKNVGSYMLYRKPA